MTTLDLRLSAVAVLAVLLSACGTTPIEPSSSHLQAAATPATNSSPAPIVDAPSLPPPQPAEPPETYSVVVHGVPVDQLLFGLARDAKINVDIRPGLEGSVTLNALNQTLPQLLDRICEQVNMRYEIRDGVIIAGPDTPYLKTYTVDYVNMSRTAKSTVTMSTSIASAGGSVAQGGGSATPNASSTEIDNQSNNNFWKTLEQNINDLLQDGEQHPTSEALSRRQAELAENATAAKAATDTSTAAAVAVANGTGPDASAQAATPAAPAAAAPKAAAPTSALLIPKNVIVNAETGVISVRGTERQQRKIAEFLARVQGSAQRQVLIEATLVEVTLSDNFQSGVDWSRVGSSLNNSLNVAQTLIGNSFGAGPVTTLTFSSDSSLFKGTLAATVKLLETFGKTKVLSSPKVVALNNQTSVLKVVDENVYFEITATRTLATATTAGYIDYTSTIKSVPIGVMMSVTPQIARDGSISLNVRPTITRITGYATDPSPALMGSAVNNLIPEIQVREIESTLKLDSGQTAVLGGLMQDSVDNTSNGIPGLMNLPLIGNLFRYRNDNTQKTELVIFLRPTIVNNPSMDGDLSNFKSELPSRNFFNEPGLETSVFDHKAAP